MIIIKHFNKEFIDTLKEAVNVPIVYEKFDEKENIPCVSYMETANVQTALGDTIGYSSISYFVKVWAHDLEQLNELSESIANKLAAYRWVRTSSNEIIDNGILCRVMYFTNNYKEFFL